MRRSNPLRQVRAKLPRFGFPTVQVWKVVLEPVAARKQEEGQLTVSLAVLESQDAGQADDLIEGRYRLVRLLGHGSVSETWQAVDVRLHRDVAVKLFVAGSTDSRREQSVLTTIVELSHPGLVRVWDAGTHVDQCGSERLYLVTELIGSRTLAVPCGTDRDPSHLAKIGRDVAMALSYLHDAGAIHAAVRASNVVLPDADAAVLDPDTAGAKLADYGLSGLLHRRPSAPTWSCRLGQLSPEQAAGLQPSAASDVYMLGSVLIGALGAAADGGHRRVSTLGRRGAAGLSNRARRMWSSLARAMLAREPGARPCARDAADRLAAIASCEPEVAR
jgi:serine/threonine protein kinase